MIKKYVQCSGRSCLCSYCQAKYVMHGTVMQRVHSYVLYIFLTVCCMHLYKEMCSYRLGKVKETINLLQNPFQLRNTTSLRSPRLEFTAVTIMHILYLYHRERILKTSTLSCNEEKEEITKPPTK